jgi:hypothetical protein
VNVAPPSLAPRAPLASIGPVASIVPIASIVTIAPTAIAVLSGGWRRQRQWRNRRQESGRDNSKFSHACHELAPLFALTHQRFERGILRAPTD